MFWSGFLISERKHIFFFVWGFVLKLVGGSRRETEADQECELMPECHNSCVNPTGHVTLWMSEDNPVISSLFLFALRQSLLLVPELPKSLLSPPPNSPQKHWGYKCTLQHPTFCGLWGFELRSPNLNCKYSTYCKDSSQWPTGWDLESLGDKLLRRPAKDNLDWVCRHWKPLVAAFPGLGSWTAAREVSWVLRPIILCFPTGYN